MQRIQFFVERRRWREAIDAGYAELATDPESITVRVLIGWSAVQLEDATLVRSMSAEILELDPACADAYDLLAEAAALADELDTAEHLIHEGLRLDSTNAVRFDRLAWILLRKGRLEDAISTAERGLQIDPQHVPTLVTLYGLSCLNDETDRASVLERQIGEVDPENSTWHLFAGSERLKFGRLSEARHRFREAVRLDPGAQEAFAFIATQLVSKSPVFKHAFLIRQWDLRLVALLVPAFWFAAGWLLWRPLNYLGWASLIVVTIALIWEGLFHLARQVTLSRLFRGEL